MDASLVVTVVARDRPGLVESVANTVSKHGGNWLESRMARLGGQFAGILRVAVNATDRDQLRVALESLQTSGLRVTVQPGEPETDPQAGRPAELTLVGQDRPGIVRQISEAFARSNVNVEELETEVTSAAMSGETMFNAKARIHIPPTCDIQRLRAELEKVATDLVVDVTLTEI